MCRRTEETSTTARRFCGVFHDSGAGYKTANLLTYLLLPVAVLRQGLLTNLTTTQLTT